ncbi:MAG: hypothetical protein M0P54_10800 [Bacteroidales bacterium]|nr:hypothetical protein [Bacteroidales bacterium]MDD3702467.1 hypothetical protein [Bacteroidales bacterium]MDY0370685.1 hypothetical protein [Bacteroidales bacterium]
MKRQSNILLIFLLLTLNGTAQIVYDTIPDNEVVFGGHVWDELFIFKDFQTQSSKYFENIDFKNIDCYGKKVFVSTVFGKNGELKNTKIIKSANPICDSIAFSFVNDLKDWLPGLARGKFIDIPFIFPISFDSLLIKERLAKTYMFYNATEEEYNKRKEKFEFVYSSQYDKKIINDFDFFKYYMAETFRDSQYVHILTEYKLKRKESIVLEFNIPKSKSLHLLVRDNQKKWIIYEYSLKKSKIRVPRDKNLLLIFYKEGINPLLQTKIIKSDKDATIELELEKYTKGRLLDEINKYSP